MGVLGSLVVGTEHFLEEVLALKMNWVGWASLQYPHLGFYALPGITSDTWSTSLL